MNEYIKLVLEKVNPKDFRSISLEVLGSNVVITDSQSQEEISHSTPSILSLGVFSGDKRYFGYIITELTASCGGSGSKQRIHCYVYRAARNSTAANIIDAVSASYQSAYSPRSDNCQLNPIYQASPYSTDNNTSATGRRYTTSSSSSSTKHHENSSLVNPIYSPGFNFRAGTRANGSYEVNGRNSIVSISSNTTNASSIDLSIHSSSAESSPSNTLDTKKHQPKNKKKSEKQKYTSTTAQTNSLIERLNSLRMSHQQNRYSMDIECLSEEQKRFLADFDSDSLCSSKTDDNQANGVDESNETIANTGSTDTLLTLTPSSPSSPASLPRSSPTLTNNKKERPKSLQLYSSHSPFGQETEVS